MKPETTALLGEQIGHIHVVDVLGEGGMGAVYIGFDEKLQRQVALKAIRSEFRMHSEAKARFLREARILSQLDHPRVCTVHDFIEGEDCDFLVLELIQGTTLRKAMRDGLGRGERMSIAGQLLEVLIAVHGQGVIHRDLKPENVMIMPDGGIKVLDFGLSRSADEDTAVASIETGVEPGQVGDEVDPDATLAAPMECESVYVQTRLGTVVGTLGYMSPEQARGEAATAASDMYSLGLIMQELFTGEPPFEDGLNRTVMLARAAEGDTRPVTGLAADLTELIERLKSVAQGARPSAKDTADLLRRIVERPVRRRRRLIAGSVVAIVFILLAALAVREGINARRLALERDTAQQVSGFLTDLFEVSDPFTAQGTEITVRELLDRGAERVETELADQPVVRARMMNTLGKIYARLGRFPQAEGLLTAAVEIRRTELGDFHTDTLSSIDDLGDVHFQAGRLEEAEKHYREALAGYRRALGDAHRSTMFAAGDLGILLLYRGDLQGAEQYCREAVDGLREMLDVDDPDIIVPMANLGYVYQQQGKLDEAEPYLRESLELARRLLGNDHPNTLNMVSAMSYLLKEQGKLDEAEPYYREVLEGQRRVLGDDHPSTLNSLGNMGLLLKLQGRLEDAELPMRQALEGRRRILGDDHSETLVSIGNLGSLLRAQGRFEEAETYLVEALEGYRRTVGDDHPGTPNALNSLGVLYRTMDRLDEAEVVNQEAIQGFRRVLGPDNPRTLRSIANLGTVRRAQGRLDEADAQYREALEGFRRVLGDQHPTTRATLKTLVKLCEERGFEDEAEELRAEFDEFDQE